VVPNKSQDEIDDAYRLAKLKEERYKQKMMQHRSPHARDLRITSTLAKTTSFANGVTFDSNGRPLEFRHPKHKQIPNLKFEMSPIEHHLRVRVREKSFEQTEEIVKNFNGVERYYDTFA
jgi:hypothetical protein